MERTDIRCYESNCVSSWIELDVAKIYQRQRALEFFTCRQAVLFPDKAPQVGERADGDVESSLGLRADVLGELQHGEQFCRNDNGIRGGAGVDASKFAVCAMDAHHSISALEFLKRGGDGVKRGSSVGAVSRDGDERAEQRLAALNEFSFGAGRICPARGQQAEQDVTPTQTSPAHA